MELFSYSLFGIYHSFFELRNSRNEFLCHSQGSSERQNFKIIFSYIKVVACAVVLIFTALASAHLVGYVVATII